MGEACSKKKKKGDDGKLKTKRQKWRNAKLKMKLMLLNKRELQRFMSKSISDRTMIIKDDK